MSGNSALANLNLVKQSIVEHSFLLSAFTWGGRRASGDGSVGTVDELSVTLIPA